MAAIIVCDCGYGASRNMEELGKDIFSQSKKTPDIHSNEKKMADLDFFLSVVDIKISGKMMKSGH